MAQTKNLKLGLPSQGSTNWGSTINANMRIIDREVAQVRKDSERISRDLLQHGYIQFSKEYGEYAFVHPYGKYSGFYTGDLIEVVKVDNGGELVPIVEKAYAFKPKNYFYNKAREEEAGACQNFESWFYEGDPDRENLHQVKIVLSGASGSIFAYVIDTYGIGETIDKTAVLPLYIIFDRDNLGTSIYENIPNNTGFYSYGKVIEKSGEIAYYDEPQQLAPHEDEIFVKNADAGIPTFTLFRDSAGGYYLPTEQDLWNSTITFTKTPSRLAPRQTIFNIPSSYCYATLNSFPLSDFTKHQNSPWAKSITADPNEEISVFFVKGDDTSYEEIYLEYEVIKTDDGYRIQVSPASGMDTDNIAAKVIRYYKFEIAESMSMDGQEESKTTVPTVGAVQEYLKAATAQIQEVVTNNLEGVPEIFSRGETEEEMSSRRDSFFTTRETANGAYVVDGTLTTVYEIRVAAGASLSYIESTDADGNVKSKLLIPQGIAKLTGPGVITFETDRIAYDFGGNTGSASYTDDNKFTYTVFHGGKETAFGWRGANSSIAIYQSYFLAKIDDEPRDDSEYLITSGGVKKYVDNVVSITEHSELRGRYDPNQHSIDAIAGLSSALDEIGSDIDVLDKEKADAMSYDSATKTLKLTANGKVISEVKNIGQGGGGGSGASSEEVQELENRIDDINKLILDLHYTGGLSEYEATRTFTSSTTGINIPTGYGELPESVLPTTRVLRIDGDTVFDESEGPQHARFKSVRCTDSNGNSARENKVEILGHDEGIEIPRWSYLIFSSPNVVTLYDYFKGTSLPSKISADKLKTTTQIESGVVSFSLYIDKLFQVGSPYSANFMLSEYKYDETLSEDKTFYMVRGYSDYNFYVRNSKYTTLDDWKANWNALALVLYGKTAGSPTETIYSTNSNSYLLIEDENGKEEIIPSYEVGAPTLTVRQTYYSFASLEDLQILIEEQELRIQLIEDKIPVIVSDLETLTSKVDFLKTLPWQAQILETTFESSDVSEWVTPDNVVSGSKTLVSRIENNGNSEITFYGIRSFNGSEESVMAPETSIKLGSQEYVDLLNQTIYRSNGDREKITMTNSYTVWPNGTESTISKDGTTTGGPQITITQTYFTNGESL